MSERELKCDPATHRVPDNVGVGDAERVHRGGDEVGQGTEEAVLTRVEIHYRLRIPPGTRETVDRALGSHQAKCPTAASLAGAVAVSWTADIQER